MSRTSFIIMMSAIAVLAFAGMWIAWRGRTRRGASAAAPSTAPLSGEVLANFPRASYVSTTPEGAPLERVAVPGLRYKGFAEVTVRRDGVSIAVTGEAAVLIPRAQLRGTGTASGRVGKAVERDGLSLLQWQLSGAGDRAPQPVESSFRFTDPAEQQRFADAVSAVLAPSAAHTPTQTTTQEDA
ncbi:hypothetical protein [Leucobacter chromiireducens]|uniref:PH domain-containing protein n=1 Tax=Leucobacter chromiireducens subsp. solipictus TaxID=398235 RepID=A0ABS1SFW9_9MICO|nr:hypothetical protein [Leucobacter chromiireducens]MBL3679451.1 hypothetical protein [Leucobacter chromiireducens subsp. solipictus]